MAGQHEQKILLQTMSSCAISDMSGLCSFGGRPAAALKEFYTQTLYSTPCLVCFHGVVEAPPKEIHSLWCQGCTYIQDFVTYVREHKLGDIVEGAKAENKKFHPGHIIQGVIWAPDYDAISRFLGKSI